MKITHSKPDKPKFGVRPFSSAEAARLLGISHRSANDYLRAAATHHLVEKTGAGPATRFRFPG